MSVNDLSTSSGALYDVCKFAVIVGVIIILVDIVWFCLRGEPIRDELAQTDEIDSTSSDDSSSYDYERYGERDAFGDLVVEVVDQERDEPIGLNSNLIRRRR